MLPQFLRLLFLGLFTVISFSVDDRNIARAQERSGMFTPSATAKGPNPPVPKDVSPAPGNRSSNVSLDGRKRLDFKQAIEAGNNARDKSDYVTAFSSYRKASNLFPNDASSHYGLGNVYFDLYCYGSAIDSYSRATRLNPKYVDALVHLGYAYLNRDEYDNAEAQFDAALKENFKNIAAKIARFYVWAKKGRYQEAIDGINKVINDTSTTDQDRASAYIALGEVYVAQNKWPESIEPFEKAKQLTPDLAEAFLKLGMAQLVTAFSKEFISVEPTIEDKALLTASARRAGETLRTAVDVKHFEHPIGYLMLGMALLYQSNYPGAEDKIKVYLSKVKEVEDRLRRIDSDLTQKCDYAFGRLYASGYIQLGSVYEREARDAGARKDELLNKAAKEYENAIAAKYDYAGGHSSLAKIYFDQRKYREAIEEFEKALIYETTDARKMTIYTVIGTTYAQLGSDNKAIDYLTRAIALDANPTTYSSLAMVHRRQGDYDEAIRLGLKAKKLEPIPTVASRYMLAVSYFVRARSNNKDEDYEEAITLLNEVIKINKTLPEAYLALGSVYKFYKNGAHLNLALANYEKAKDYDPQNAAIYFHLGDVHASTTHNYDAAIKYLSEAIRLKPDYAMAHWTLAVAYREKKDDAAAIKQILEGLKYQKDLNAYIMLAYTYERQKNYAEAIKILQEAVRLEPESHSPYLQLAIVYSRQKNNDDAIRYYEQALNRVKPDDRANRDLYHCRIVRLQHRYTEALDCFQKLVYPLPTQVPYDVGVTYVLMGNKQAALAQHLQLTQLKSPLAEELMRQINEMKTDR